MKVYLVWAYYTNGNMYEDCDNTTEDVLAICFNPEKANEFMNEFDPITSGHYDPKIRFERITEMEYWMNEKSVYFSGECGEFLELYIKEMEMTT